MQFSGQFIGVLIDGMDPAKKQTISEIKEPMLIQGSVSGTDSASEINHFGQVGNMGYLSISGLNGYLDVLGKLNKKIDDNKDPISKVEVASYTKQKDLYVMTNKVTAEKVVVRQVDTASGSVMFSVMLKIHWETLQNNVNIDNRVVNIELGSEE